MTDTNDYELSEVAEALRADPGDSTPPEAGGCWWCRTDRGPEVTGEIMEFSVEWDAYYHPTCHYRACLIEGRTLPV